jgi:hypothetical protein
MTEDDNMLLDVGLLDWLLFCLERVSHHRITNTDYLWCNVAVMGIYDWFAKEVQP